MIKLYKDLNVYDFINEFEGLDNTSWAHERKALIVLYDCLVNTWDEALDYMDIKDWLRFQVMEMKEEEIKKSYSNIFKGYSDIENFLNDYTVIYGTYESNGKTFYLFGEF